MSELPARPSKEHLRKQAKRLARDKSLGLAEAQRTLAADYGANSWAELMRRVDAARGDEAIPLPPLAAAARAGDLAAVRRLIVEGQPTDEGSAKVGPPLWQACASDAPAETRIAIAEALLSAGASPRHDGGGETALHAAANRGPLALVELLIRKGALEWQPDRKGHPPLAAARRGKAGEAAIMELLARPVIRDPSFRAAVTALQRGDVAALARLLDDEPRLLRERILEPECYREASRSQYFRDPKLFWFIANNPTLMKRMPDNIVEVAETMIARGVDKADLDYALELVMTSSPAREQGLQIPLLERLMKAGATPTSKAIDVTLAHWELGPIRALLQSGHPMTAPIAAAFGETDRLKELLRRASAADVQNAFGMAVINRQNEAARLALDAGADVNGFLPVHAHSTALHQAAIDENLDLMELLVERGARIDIADKLWDSTPLGWASHQGKARARAFLEGLRQQS
ncbi:Ankyrin repeat-containing protein [Rhodospirillales bacterium URHD0017]|nr:Ankyrin repeat-containing protein [Rhodospirillales bacterium URHD0017]